MASHAAESERARLYKFTKILTLKVAQIVVQSRDGKKITHAGHPQKPVDSSPLSTSPVNLQWFNLSIPDEPTVNCDTKRILNGEIITALTNILCIEISLKTVEGDEMVLELWTVKLAPCMEAPLTSVSTIYYRMSVMLKSTLSITRITPAYKMSRSQNKETYQIYHKIYGGEPDADLLGDNHKEIKVSELHTPIGTILIGVLYRTNMTMLPEDGLKTAEVLNSNGSIMVKSDHFPTEHPRRDTEKKSIDLNKPLTAGAFVDHDKMRELRAMLNQQLPPEPPLAWLLAEQERETKMKLLADAQKFKQETEVAHCSTSKAIEVPKPKEGEKYSSLMEFPFADGSPMTELANFYQECVQLRSATDEWSDVLTEHSTDSDNLSQQLKMYEDAVPEFDNMVASMFSSSDNIFPVSNVSFSRRLALKACVSRLYADATRASKCKDESSKTDILGELTVVINVTLMPPVQIKQSMVM